MRALTRLTRHLSSRGSVGRLRSGLVLIALVVVLLTACSGSTPIVSGAEEATPTVSATPADDPTVAAPTLPADPTPTPAAEPAPPACGEVPAFSSADTVSIACSGSFAVSPELFANNAGWHLFQATEGTWEEIDYARTCCEADDVSFSDLLARNGIEPAAQAELCLGSGLGTDQFSGCAAGADDTAFEATWLRVNGLGANDFGAATGVVIDSIAQVFGPPVNLVEARECGAGPMEIASFEDFTVQFQDDALIGWYYAGSTPELTTPSGVALGISEADLTVVYDGVEIRDDSLGREFFFEVPAGFMAGFISETDATVTALYAGTNCFFR